MIPLIGSVISGIFGVGKQYLSNKAEKSQAKHEQEVAIIRGDQTWDQIQAANSGDSWKDEYLVIVITAPIIVMYTAAALGDMEVVRRLEHAFIIIQTRIPEQYWTLLYVAFAASFGIKGIVKGARTFIDGKKE
jgi:hypothetical protein